MGGLDGPCGLFSVITLLWFYVSHTQYKCMKNKPVNYTYRQEIYFIFSSNAGNDVL